MKDIRKTNYFILAGTSGTGKTVVLQQLSSIGYKCTEESARAVLSEQLAIDGPALPSKNPQLFIQSMMDRNIKNFDDLITRQEFCFFDRGMLDLIHYAIRFNTDPAIFQMASQKYLYNKKVFLFTPWKEIFVNDNERRMTFEKSLEFHDILVKSYLDCGYELIQVPHSPVDFRAQFILENITG